LPENYCVNDGNLLPDNLNFFSGTFSASGNLQIDDSSGEINVINSLADNTYTITYTQNGVCANSFEQVIAFEDVADPNFQYVSNEFCIDEAEAEILFVNNPGGTFTTNATEISINGSGNVDLSYSTNGSTYEIMYSVGAGNCNATSIQNIQIIEFIEPILTTSNIVCLNDTFTILLENYEAFNAAEISWNYTNLTVVEEVNYGTIRVISNEEGVANVQLMVDNADNACGIFQINETIIVQSPLVLYTKNYSINAGEQLSLQLFPANFSHLIYQWDDSEELSCLECFNPIATPLANSSYMVSVIDTISGCVSHGVVEIKVEQAKPYFPNTFSPNFDGKNDMFLALNLASVSAMKLSVYDRWGELLFYTEDPEIGWNGNYKGKKMNSAVYVYTAQFTLTDNTTFFHKGNVTLLR